MNLDTPDLLNVVEELSTKSNPKDSAGTIDPKIAQDWTKKICRNRENIGVAF